MATLADLEKRVRNTTNRNSQAFLLTENVDETSTNYAVDGVDTNDNYFEVYDNDLSSDSEFSEGESIYIKDSTGNDQVFTIDSVTTGDFDGEADSPDSRINVKESVPDATVDGTIYTALEYLWRNFGRFMEASLETSVVASSGDQDGRESSELFELTGSFALMQTSNTELALMEELAMPNTEDYDLYLNGHTVYFSGSHQITTTEMNDATDNVTGDVDFNTLSDPDGLQFVNVLLKPEPGIDLAGEESSIGIEFTGIVELQELSDLDTDQTIIVSYE